MILSLPLCAAVALPPEWQELTLRVPAAVGITTGFALLARGLRGVTNRGALAGALVTLLVFLAAGTPGFLAILMVFVLTTAATQVGYSRKVQLGTAELRTGRNARQVFANLLVSALVVTPAIFFSESRRFLFVGACASLAEAAADTVSSELGQVLVKNAYLVTNLQPVPVGQNGGISVVGTFSGMVAAFLMAFSCWWLHLVSPTGFVIVLISAVLGMFFDSLLGATIERPGRLGNNSVNFLSTTFAASIGLIGTLLFE